VDLIPSLTPSPAPTPVSVFPITSRLTDPRLKNWLAKVPGEVNFTDYLSVIVVPEQKNYIFKGKELLKVYPVSTGAGQNKMPEGIWRIGDKKSSGLSQLYGPRLMFFELWDNGQFKETTRAFHGTSEPEKIGSNFGLGCVYHYNKDILEIYDLLPRGSLVVTTGDSSSTDWEILAGGTVVLSRGVDERIRKYKDVNYPWKKIKPLTRSADLTIVNFKSPFVKDCPYVPDKTVFCSQADYVKGIVSAGVDLVSVAGNHLGDYGVEGIEYTVDVLLGNDILFTGAGRNATEAFKPQIVELKKRDGDSLKIGFFSFNTVAGTSPAAGKGSTGVAWWDENLIKGLVENIRSYVDILMVMPNWGVEYTHQPTAGQIEIGHKLVNWGVDVVLGDQAHWVQKYEEYNGGLIFYGLGNLVFDQMWSQKTREGMLVKLKINQDKEFSFELIPTVIEDYAQPRLASAKETAQILGYMR
ncbi:hypothetical protein B5M47_02545, partial [candidate division CPR3 bacterium 4484_211]